MPSRSVLGAIFGAAIAALLTATSVAQTPIPLGFRDCNQNGIPDRDELPTNFGAPRTEADADYNGTIDACEPFDFQKPFFVDLDAPANDFAFTDFNEDGLLDLVVTLPGEDRIQLVRNIGFGRFVFDRELPVVGRYGPLVIQDVNNDDLPDIVVHEPLFELLTVFLLQVDGSYVPRRSSVGSGRSSTEFYLADLNDDGFVDGVVDGRVMIGSGDGLFTIGADVGDGDAFPFDLNQDGVPELIFRGDVYTRNPDGTYQIELRTFLPRDARPSGDFNGDGITDFLNRPNRPSEVFLAPTSGITAELVDLDSGPSFAAGNSAVAAADFDADGRAELVLGAPFQSSSDPDYVLSIVYDVVDPELQRFSALLVDDSFERIDRIEAADINNDGLLDVIGSSDSSPRILVLLGKLNDCDGNGVIDRVEITARPERDSNFDGFLDTCELPAGFDCNGNGLSDLAEIAACPALVVPLDRPGVPPTDAQRADFNADGLNDIAYLRTAESEVCVILAQAGTTLAPEQCVATGANPVDIFFADINRDGRTDVVTANSVDGSATVLLADPAGQLAQRIDIPVLGVPAQVGAGDFDADGLIDVLVCLSDQSECLIYYQDQLDTFVLDSSIGLPGRVDIAVTDFNLDGLADFVASDIEFSQARFAQPGRTFDGGFALLGGGPRGGYVDLTGDGVADLVNPVAVSLLKGWIQVVPGTQSGPLGFRLDFDNELILRIQPDRLGLGRPTTSFDVADFNSDGMLDLIVGFLVPNSSNVDRGRVLVVPGNEDGTFDVEGTLSVELAAPVFYVSAGDFSGSPGPEIVAFSDDGTAALIFPRNPDCGPNCNRNDFVDACELAAGLLPDRSQTGIPDTCERPGDMNCDRKVNLDDLDRFIAVLLNDPGTDPNPDCPRSNADMDLNGVINTDDAILFTDRVTAGRSGRSLLPFEAAAPPPADDVVGADQRDQLSDNVETPDPRR